MTEIILNLSLIILASMYFGVIIGRQGNRKAFEQKVQEASEKAENSAKQKQKELAGELHGELSKIRDSIIDSAQAYQSAVQAVGEKLVPLEDLAEQLGPEEKIQLPLFAGTPGAESGTPSGDVVDIDDTHAASVKEEPRSVNQATEEAVELPPEEVVTKLDDSQIVQESSRSSEGVFGSQDSETQDSESQKVESREVEEDDHDVGDTLRSATEVDPAVIHPPEESERDTLEVEALSTSPEEIIEEGTTVR